MPLVLRRLFAKQPRCTLRALSHGVPWLEAELVVVVEKGAAVVLVGRVERHIVASGQGWDKNVQNLERGRGSGLSPVSHVGSNSLDSRNPSACLPQFNHT